MDGSPRRLLTTAEAAKLLALSPRSLEGLRLRGGGPPFYKPRPRMIRYAEDELLEWVMRERFVSTSEARGAPFKARATRPLSISTASRVASSKKRA